MFVAFVVVVFDFALALFDRFACILFRVLFVLGFV